MGKRLLIAALGAVILVVTFSSIAHADDAALDLRAMRKAAPHEGPAWLAASGDDLSLRSLRLDTEPLPDHEPCKPCCLKWDVMLGMWLSGLNGDATIDGQDVEFDIKPKDLLDLLDKVEFVLEGRISATYGNWLFYLGGMTIDAGDTIEGEIEGPIGGPRTIGADIDLSLTIVEAGVGYCLGKCVTGQDCCGREKSVSYYVYAGARYFSIEQDVAALTLPISSSADESFVDPIVGGLVQWQLGNKWSVDLEANIGGFGVGSDFAWKARAGVRYQFTRAFYAALGFLVLDIDVEDGNFAWDVTMYGPYLGIGFTF